MLERMQGHGIDLLVHRLVRQFHFQVKAASDIYAPVSGQIEAVNEKLNDEPSLLNKQPESDGESPRPR